MQDCESPQICFDWIFFNKTDKLYSQMHICCAALSYHNLTFTFTRDNAVVFEVAFVKFLQLHFPFKATLR